MNSAPFASRCSSLWCGALLFALMGLSTLSLVAVGTEVAVLLVMAIPFLTFIIGAPGRIRLASELRLAIRELECLFLSALLRVTGQAQKAETVSAAQKKRVLETYKIEQSSSLGQEQARFLLGRSVANWGALWVTAVGLAMPFQSETLSYGPAAHAPFIFILDAGLFWMISRLALGRVSLRLCEGIELLKPSRLADTTLCALWTPFSGGVLGAVGGLVLGQVLGVASAMETLWVMPQLSIWQVTSDAALNFTFLSFVPMALAGTIIGACLGVTLPVKKASK